MATQQVVLSEPLSAERAAGLGLDQREYLIGEQITISDVNASRLQRAGYAAPVGASPTTTVVQTNIAIVDPNGVTMAARAKLKFAGSAVLVADDVANGQTVVTPTGTSGSGGSGVSSVNGQAGAVTVTAVGLGAVTSVNGRAPSAGAVSVTAADVGALTQTAADARYALVGAGGASPTIENVPSGTTITVIKSGSTWPARPTARTDIIVRWRGADPSPPIVASGTGGMLDNIDERQIPAP